MRLFGIESSFCAFVKYTQDFSKRTYFGYTVGSSLDINSHYCWLMQTWIEEIVHPTMKIL